MHHTMDTVMYSLLMFSNLPAETRDKEWHTCSKVHNLFSTTHKHATCTTHQLATHGSRQGQVLRDRWNFMHCATRGLGHTLIRAYLNWGTLGLHTSRLWFDAIRKMSVLAGWRLTWGIAVTSANSHQLQHTEVRCCLVRMEHVGFVRVRLICILYACVLITRTALIDPPNWKFMQERTMILH